MRIVPYAIKGAFIIGVLTTVAVFTGTTVGYLAKKNKIFSKLKDAQFKKNKIASSK